MNTFLHVGCGPKRKDKTTAGFADWIELRFDIDVSVAPDLVGTMTDMIGCAEGYYAVGMAMRMPGTQVLAFDLNPQAQEVCSALAQKNGVSDRVKVSALFKPEDFVNYANQKILVLCDIEGAERELLDPATAPALAGMDLIVESHECLLPGITQLLIDRFKNSHQITLVQDDGQRQLVKPPPWFIGMAHLDQLLATWEWRSGATPWLVMQSKKVQYGV